MLIQSIFPLSAFNILSRQLPKTMQTTERQSGDDGTHQAGWWKGRGVADNRERFVIINPGVDAVVLDKATGLMWACDNAGEGCYNDTVIAWSAAITYANGLNWAGYDDWRLPNINELGSIVDWSKYNPAIDVNFFVGAPSADVWSSTTYAANSIYAWVVTFSSGQFNIRQKTNSDYIRLVRGGL